MWSGTQIRQARHNAVSRIESLRNRLPLRIDTCPGMMECIDGAVLWKYEYLRCDAKLQGGIDESVCVALKREVLVGEIETCII